MTTNLAIITGANKGLGFGIVKILATQHKDFTVLLTARDEQAGRKAAEELKKLGLNNIDFHVADVASDESVNKLKEYVEKKYNSKVDILINNAAVLSDNFASITKVSETDMKVLESEFNINVYGTLRIYKAFIPMMKKRGYGRVINLSSGMGTISAFRGGIVPYQLSKCAVNALTVMESREEGVADSDILVNSVCPGLVRTTMSKDVPEDMPAKIGLQWKTPEEAAEDVLEIAFLPKGGPSGKFFRYKKEISFI